jgi:hypothetical protein
MLKRTLGLAILCAAVTVLLVPQAALAAVASPTTVNVAWGDYAVQIAQVVALLAFALLMWLARKLPPQILTMLVSAHAEQLLANAIGWGLNTVEGAVAGQKLNVGVGSAVTAQALQYVLDHEAWLVAWLGGPQGVAQKIWARLPLDASASQTSFNKLAAELPTK